MGQNHYRMRRANPYRVSTYAYAPPLVAAGIGTTILGEPIWPGAVAGATLVIGAVALELRTTR